MINITIFRPRPVPKVETFNDQQKEDIMKKQLLIIAVCFLGAFAVVQDANAGDYRNNQRSSQFNRGKKHSDYKNHYNRDSLDRKPTGWSFGLSNGGFYLSFGGGSSCSRSVNFSSYRLSSSPVIINISNGYRYYRPSYCRETYLQRWSDFNKCWLYVRTIR